MNPIIIYYKFIAVTTAPVLFFATVANAATNPDGTPSRTSSSYPPPLGMESTQGPNENLAPSNTPNDSSSTTSGKANKSSDVVAHDTCVKEVQDALGFFNQLQEKPDTSIPLATLAEAKAVIFIDRWAAGAVIGGTGGRAIVYQRGDNGKFAGPAFYDIAGGSVGAQLGVSHVKTVALLMNAKALQTLNDSKFIWSGNLRAVAGHGSTSKSTVNNNADVYLYQTAAGLDIGATVAATRLIPDETRDRAFYNNSTLTPANVYGNQSANATDAQGLLAILNQSANNATTP